jgi:hypothetical protein
MLLGRVLERLGDEGFAAETLVGLRDLPLLVDVEAAGRQFGESPGEYAAGATRRFAAFASDEDWLALMTALERGAAAAQDSPDSAGAACLRHMLAWSLRFETEHPDGEPSGADCAGGHCTCKES